ncbi:protein FAM83B [Nerophis lumbriciformis]|uniref:protein FAM83B n=1 Tax=Nerophis lumbriciformis TaxID=546530 RepID=UPI002ADFF8BD|nr:protein FAM83B [Nerophis lumbriciformis]XP_061812948.1 protein FAM83B [Nerophis lumbriciformis]
MESSNFSSLSSIRGEYASGDYMQSHYKESYRLAIDCLLSGGRDSYAEFLKGERTGSFLSEDELDFITTNAKQLPPQNNAEEDNAPTESSKSSSGTYWPVNSDVDAPNLDLGWPEVVQEKQDTNIDLLYHPPRQNSPSIKEVVLKNIRNARQVIGIVMDMFTDVDIFKEAVDASIRGIPVYVLLNDSHLKHFLTTAENQDVKIQQLRNMRVRTVKGEDYLCRSGTKFHGEMEQKFILVDCHTVIFGSYSFTWSCGRINLSMVQVITGHLVKSYDEEFRTLYARSAVPAELCQPEGSLHSNGLHDMRTWPKYNSHCSQTLDRRDQLRHTLDSVYRKTCERNQYGPLIEHDSGLQKHMSQFQSTETMNFLKRHSYAGERQDGYTPQNVRTRASNWNITRETGIGTNHYPLDNNYLAPHMYRSQQVRQSYNGNDKHVLSIQQNMPTLEKTSKSFMRTWRIESYLKNPDVPYGESDYLDPFDRRMRSSLNYRSAIPEQMEITTHIKPTSSVGNPSSVHNALHYSSMQWNPIDSNRSNNDEFIMRRKTQQMLEDYGGGTSAYPSSYASLGRAQRGQIVTNPDLLTNSWNKRHSVADSRSNSSYTQDSSSAMYGGFSRMQIDRGTTGINHGGYGSNLNVDQRSVSQYDVKSTTTSSWRDQPARTVSDVALDRNDEDLTVKSNIMGSQQFLKKSTKKIKSFLNIPDKRESQTRTIETPSVTSESSTDTIKGEDESAISESGFRIHPSNSSSGYHKNHTADVKYSEPRFTTEEQRPAQISRYETQSKADIPDKSNDIPGWNKDRKTDHRLYSRFEPFCSVEKKQPLRSPFNYPEKTKTKSEAVNDHSFHRLGRSHHENKIEKFFHKVGNFIHKNK